MKLSLPLCLVLLVSGTCWAGTLKGKFTFKKKAPKVALIYFTEDTSLTKGAVIDQKEKKFLSRMYVGCKGSKMILKNSDTIAHNIFARDPSADVNFDIGLMAAGSQQDKEIFWDEGKVVRISCKIHPKMRSYVASIKSAFHKIVEFPKKKKTLNFEIKGVPDHLTKVRVWIPKYKEINVEVKKGSQIKADVKKKTKARGTLELSHE